MAKSHFFGVLAGALLLVSTAAHAATVTFALDNVNFGTVAAGGTGTITGSFAFDGTNLTNVNLMASGAISADYTSGSLGAPGTFDFTNGTTVTTLVVTTPVSFSAPNPLVLSATSFIGSSSIIEDTFGLHITSGSLDPTPLPAALPLFATGIGGLGLLGWRRKRKAKAV
jgi:hypothetical protein